MNAKILLTSLLLTVVATQSQAQMAIGKWRDCLDHSKVYHVEYAGDRVYAASKGGLFYLDLDDNILNTLGKSNGLSDVRISAMGYDAASRTLVLAYDNSNIDILCNDRVYNLSDIKRSELPGDKSVFHVRLHGGNAYLATGFGVVVVNLARREIKETWYLGTGGTRTQVYDIAFSSDSIYVATGEGLKHLDINNTHPAVNDRWTVDHRFDSLTVTTLQVFGNKLVAAAHTGNPAQLTLYASDANSFHAWNKGNILSMRADGSLLTVTRLNSVCRYNTSFTRYDSISDYVWGTLAVNDALTAPDGSIWVGHAWAGMLNVTPQGNAASFLPEGPYSGDNVYRLVPFNYRMMLCPGGHTVTYSRSYLDPNLLTSQGLNWTMLDKSNGVLDGTGDLLDAAVNPYDTTEVVAALWGHGVVSIRDNVPQVLYNASNTGGALVPFSDPSYPTLNTGALAFDRQGDLWIAVSHSTNGLAVRHRDGTWNSFSTTAVAPTLELDKLVCDSITGYKWFCGRSNVIYVHDGESKFARVDPNRGSKLTTTAVTALVQDQSGNLWVGTNKGIKVIYDAYKAFQSGGNGEVSPVSCSNVTITNGEFSEYLMAYESITAIAVDGANRKWVGTQSGGLYLLSANGMDQLQHFTAANSPLFSDKIIAIGINERTGEVFVGTDKGLQVFRGTATYAVSEPLDEVYAFPNPVRPDYDGPIAIKGFTRNGHVHITDASGHTVYSTTANGGQAIWYGRTQNGDRVASGVYYVFAADAQGNNRSVAKILVIR